MKELFKEVIRINMMENALDAERSAEQFFSRLNSMKMPEYFNWAKEIFEDLHASSNPDKTALIWTDTSLKTRTYSYGQLLEKANRLINLMRAYGVEKKDSFYTMTPVLSENWAAALASIKAGFISVPTAVSMTQRELEFRFETYPPDVVIAAQESADVIDAVLADLEIVPKIKLIIGERDGWVSFDSIDQYEPVTDAAQTRSDDILFCFFTSGTTGLPKRVGHTAVSYPVGHLTTSLMMGLTPDDIHNSLSESGWAKSIWSRFFAPFNVGATTSGFNFSLLDGEQYLDAISRHKITSFCAQPGAWQMIANMNLDSFDLSSLKKVVSIGEPLRPDISEKWMRSTGIPIREFYSQTEATTMIGNAPWMKDKIRSGMVGFPMGMYDMALADNEGNEITAPGQVGHIVIKLNNWRPVGLFSEYIGNPEKMSSVFVDNYYYTGDRACFDADGYWQFMGRADDVIKSSDHRIGPFEVESALTEHPYVAEAAVIGAPDAKRYQLVKAYVVLNSNIAPSRQTALELFKHTIEILPKFKIPRLIEFVPEVPKTISGKIRRIELRQMETTRQANLADEGIKEYFYWDFPELSSKKKK
ncbi:MAG: AMP-binding protein [Pseudomonadota bacterium]